MKQNYDQSACKNEFSLLQVTAQQINSIVRFEIHKTFKELLKPFFKYFMYTRKIAHFIVSCYVYEDNVFIQIS